jgi:hypothetical protein
MATAARPPGHLGPAAGDDASDPFMDALLAPLAAKIAGASRNAVHFAIRMAAGKSMRVIGCGARGRSG